MAPWAVFAHYTSAIYIFFTSCFTLGKKKASKQTNKQNSSCLLQPVKPCVLPVKPGTRCFSTSPCLFALCCLCVCMCLCVSACVPPQAGGESLKTLPVISSSPQYNSMLAGSPHCGEAANCALHFIARLKMPLSATVKVSFWTRHSQRSSPLKKKNQQSLAPKKKPSTASTSASLSFR